MAITSGAQGLAQSASAEANITPNVPANTETKIAGDNSSDPNVQALLKKEVRLVKEQEAIKKERLEWQEKIKRADMLLARDKEFNETKSKDTVAALRMLGFNDTEIFNAVAASAPTEKTPEEKAEEVARRVLKENNDKLEADRVKAEADKNTKVIESFQKSIAQTIDTNADKYEFCKFNGSAAQELIYETVAETLKETQKLLTVSEAADLVEKYYEDKAREMDALRKRKPVEPVVEAKVEAKRETVVQPKIGTGEAPRPTKTLTNRVAAQVTTGQKSESPSEKRERLAQVLRSGDTSLLRR